MPALISPPCLSKILKKGQPPQRNCLPTILQRGKPSIGEEGKPSHTGTLLHSPLWEKHAIRHQVEIANGFSGVLPPQHVETQLDARHADQIDDGPFEAKASHVVEVIGSHYHLPLSNMKGVGSIPSPLNEALANFSRRKPMIGSKPAFRI